MNYNEYKYLQENHAGDWDGGWAEQSATAAIDYFKDKSKDSKIIDIGCAYGRTIYELQLRGYTNCTGLDISEKKMLFGKDKGIKIIVGDAHKIPFDDKYFDYAILFHTIEHAIQPKLMLLEMLRVSKAGFIICPIEPGFNFELGSHPHTSAFTSESQYTSLFLDIPNYNFTHISKQRMCQEVWTFYNEK